jgi:alkylation response protein AidB-like acyl-CoA dehydrogenase
MEFDDSETQRLLRSTARSYLAEAYPWERLYRLEAGGERLSAPDTGALRDLGWLTLLAPEAAGGGASLLDAAVIAEELGYAGVATPVAVANISGSLLASANNAAGSELLASLVRDNKLCTISEASRRRSRGADGSLVASGGRIDGTLPVVPFADLCAFVLAPVSIDGVPAFAALPLAAAQLDPVEVLDARSSARVRFDAVRLERAAVLATGLQADELHDRCDALVTAFSLIELAGMMQRALELTTAHITTRVQFERPIATFQAARHRAAELLVQVETTRWAAYHALWRFERDPADREEIWLAKHWAVRAADRVYQHSHMLHGGVGVSMEHPLHLFTQGIAAFAVRGGTMDEMVSRTLDSLRLSEAAAR